MAQCDPQASWKPRELRRSVLLPARLRTPAGWGDACILNISSHGLLVHAHWPAVTGSVIELYHREHVLCGEVVWASGARAGVRAFERLPVEEILTLGQSPALQLTAGNRRTGERRQRPRDHDGSRLKARAMEFAAASFIAISLASGAVAMMNRAFTQPLNYVERVLRR